MTAPQLHRALRELKQKASEADKVIIDAALAYIEETVSSQEKLARKLRIALNDDPDDFL